jgi:2-aminoethylphosphonate-pyruvate transaminase
MPDQAIDRLSDPWLLTPGPLTTSATVKAAMRRDWGSRDAAFIAMNARILTRLAALAGAADSHVAVPVQGSGTFAVEAMIGTLVPRAGKLLVLVNGAYGQRMVRIAHVMGRACAAIETDEATPVSARALTAALARDPAITHVAVVHCETTSGILNPLEAVAGACAEAGRPLLVDAMSAFGALPLDAARLPAQAVAASANKCLEGVPGVGFVVAERAALAAARGNAHSLSLDLEDQWRGLAANGQWRFTPPTHVLAAFDRALDEHAAEGGVAGRGARYRANHRILVDGMAELGFETLVPLPLQAPIIVTFRMPADPAFVFETFYDRLRARGFVIYPGKLTLADSFRIGCIGRLGETEMRAALAAIGATLAEMGVRSGAPATAAAGSVPA